MIEDDGWLYLELADVRQIIERWGIGPIHDHTKIESACARPRQAFGDHTPYPDAASKASALGWGLVRAHGLVDGNKRLGAIATLYFLHSNGFDAAVTEGELLAIFLQVARGDMEQEEVCLFLRPRIALAPAMDPIVSDAEFTAMLQPHLDAIHLFTQQAGTEAVVAGEDYWMVLDHLRALIEIAKQLVDGPARQAVLSVVENFLEVAKGFNFIGIPSADTGE